MHHEIESTRSQDEDEAATPMEADSSLAELSPQALIVSSGNPDNAQMAFFVHGTPGVASDWELVFEELSRRKFDCGMVALDRVGFGVNEAWPRSEKWDVQLDSFRALLFERAKMGGRVVLVGHSYGAALALGLAERLERDGCVSGMVLVAGVLSPDEKQCRWYHRVVLNPIVGCFLPRRYVQSAKEMSAVGVHLSELGSAWSRFDFPVTLIHGDEDRLIPLQNSKYALQMGNPEKVRLVEVAGGGHDLTKTHAELIADEIVNIFERIQEKGARHVC